MRKDHRNKWFASEVRLLKKVYPKAFINECVSLFPRHTKKSIYQKARYLKLKRKNFNIRKKSCVKYLSDRDKGYIAGLIDGEGTIAIHKACDRRRKNPRYYPMIQISNTNRDLLEFCKLKIGAGGVYLANRNRFPNRKPTYVFHVQAMLNVQDFLNQVIEALILKREQAKIVLEFIEKRLLTRKQSVSLYERIRLLNIKGTH